MGSFGRVVVGSGGGSSSAWHFVEQVASLRVRWRTTRLTRRILERWCGVVNGKMSLENGLDLDSIQRLKIVEFEMVVLWSQKIVIVRPPVRRLWFFVYV